MSIRIRQTVMAVSCAVVAVALAQLACTAARPSSGGPPDSATPSPEVEPPLAQPPGGTPASPSAPAATPQAAAIPDRPLSAEGPWIAFMAFAADHELWAMNADGSGLSRLWSYFDDDPAPAGETFTLWPAPRGGRIALLRFDPVLQTAPLLSILQLPSGDVLPIASLLPRDVDLQALGGDEASAASQVWAAVGPRNNPVWSSDGRWLAFNASIDGPSADVYVYDTTTEQIERLTDGPDQSTDLVWSPDDGYIVHSVARSLYYGYSGIGYDMLAAWAVPPDPAESAIRLYNHAFLGFENILGWLNDSSYLGDSFSGEELGNCGYFHLRTVDLLKGEGPEILAGHYSLRAFDPDTRTILLVLTPVLEEFDCGTSLEPGVYLMNVDTRKPTQIPNVSPDSIMSVTWSREAGLFFLGGGPQLLAVDAQGNVLPLPSIEDLYDAPPIVAPGGDAWALESGITERKLVVGTRDGTLIPIDAEDPQEPFWSPDGAWLFFFAGGLHLSAVPAPDFGSIQVIQEGLLGADAPVRVGP